MDEPEDANRTNLSDTIGLLRQAGLRPTRQRQILAQILFEGPRQHVTIDGLFQVAAARTDELSLATVYNTMNQFTRAGLVRKINLSGERTYFDTDIGDHHHFYIEEEDRIIDVMGDAISYDRLPELPEGYEVAGVDVVIHLKRRERRECAEPGQSNSPVRCLSCPLREQSISGKTA